ncbi:L-ribulose-5-phosphate 4-epimerase [Microbacterium sp. 4R-513]|uniref:class II aldolase/adducin family protein n=1 Tax=Microbacterium sp. 4R-513 TaxID=2567934 RepID=UPI0013E15831|nr:class II aldolase/adducin family protein [Microbacterium sp. 4R-513]QIG39529.1 L-ribulose-5-phosphate 4-epimerase [Microbacterium sp. 4R-513]
MAQGRGTELREDYVSGVRTEVTTARVRADVATLHGELLISGLALAVGGALSARIPGADLFVVTPADVPFAAVGPENLVLCDLDGAVVTGTPGSDLLPHPSSQAHAHVYRRMPAIGAIAQLHSTYATAWAARAEPIPCAFAVAAEEFGGPVPVGPYAGTDDEALGRAVVEVLEGQRSRAVLLEQQGPVTVGATPREAAMHAALLEDVARVAHVTRDGGAATPLPQAEIDRLWESRRARGDAPTPGTPAVGSPKQKRRQLNIDTKTKTSR